MIVDGYVEQEEIVRRVDQLLTLADRLEVRYNKAKALVDKLSQSILSKACRGEPVTTEDQLAKAEGRTYEKARSSTSPPPSTARFFLYAN